MGFDNSFSIVYVLQFYFVYYILKYFLKQYQTIINDDCEVIILRKWSIMLVIVEVSKDGTHN